MMMFLLRLLKPLISSFLTLLFLIVIHESKSSFSNNHSPSISNIHDYSTSNCFPSIKPYPSSDFRIPTSDDDDQLDAKPGWWCERDDEYAWLGFSYDVEDCPSLEEMIKSFKWMKVQKGARYVRIYGSCDHHHHLKSTDSFDHDLIEAAVEAQLGIISMIWFGFQGNNDWKRRKQDLINEIKKNSHAPYIIRAVTLGSEPLLDGVLDLKTLEHELKDLRNTLKPYGIPVTISEMTYAFQQNQDAPQIFNVMDLVSLNVLPVFDTDATTSDQSWRFIEFCINYGKTHGQGKPVIITQTGWPSNKQEANVMKAITDITQEKAYFQLLNDHCSSFKASRVGWFAHIFSEVSLPGWGVILEDGSEKFDFEPLTSC